MFKFVFFVPTEYLDAVKEAVIQALRDNVKVSELNRLLDYYRGLRRIADKHSEFVDGAPV